MNLFLCGKFWQQILLDQSDPLHSDLFKCRSHARTRSIFQFALSCININRKLTIHYLVRIRTGREQVVTDFRHNLSQFQVHFYFSRGFTLRLFTGWRKRPLWMECGLLCGQMSGAVHHNIIFKRTLWYGIVIMRKFVGWPSTCWAPQSTSGLRQLGIYWFKRNMISVAHCFFWTILSALNLILLKVSLFGWHICEPRLTFCQIGAIW